MILIGGWWLPNKLTFFILQRELKKEEERREKENWIDKKTEKRGKPWQKLEQALINTLQQEINNKNQAKIGLEKEILKLRENKKKLKQEVKRREEKQREYFRNQHLPEWQGKGEEIRKEYLRGLNKSIKTGYLLEQKEWEWIGKWGEKEDLSVLLFCGEEFNHELLKVRTTFKGSWQLVNHRDWCSNVIDFNKYGNFSPQFLQDKIREIYQQSGNQTDMNYKQSKHSMGENNILFKNIDRIVNPDLKNELLLVLDTTKNKNLGKITKKIGEEEIEEAIDLSKFLLIATTSISSPKLPQALFEAKLKHVEPLFDRYFWIIFLASGGMEIFVFSLIIRRTNKNQKRVF